MTHFYPALGLLSLSFLIDLFYLFLKPGWYKKGLKLWRMGGCAFFIAVYWSAAHEGASYFIKSGQATVVGIVFFAASFVFDTIVDWSSGR